MFKAGRMRHIISSSSAFTLIELMVAIGIMVVLTVMALPVVGPLMSNRAMEGSYGRIYGAIYKARSLAASNNLIYCLRFVTTDDQSNHMIIYGNNPLSPQSDLTNWTFNATDQADEPIKLEKGIKFKKLNQTDVTTATSFYFLFCPDGTVYPPTGTAASTMPLVFCNATDTTKDQRLLINSLTGEMTK